MLPSMPVLFTRESQDAFGNKVEPSTSFFHQNLLSKPSIQLELPPPTICEPSKIAKDSKKESKPITKKKEEPRKIDESAFETALVRSYYTKVQSRFASNPMVPTNKFVQFQDILKSFDPSKETPVNLYKKIEQLFGEEHKDIVEEFLLFLKPGQAVQVGRFMDQFMLVQITSFIDMLQTALARKPTVLRKILRLLTTGIHSGNSKDMKSRILPHLRSNTRLTQIFKSLFPDERPPDSVYETGTDIIHESFLTNDKGYDVWEFEEPEDNKRKLKEKDNIDTMYVHGRVFLQHGRLLRSASVTYPYSKEPYRMHARRLAPPHCHLSPPDSDDERASPKRNPKKIPPKRAKKPLKSPTKTVKDVNDNTKHKDTNLLNSPKSVKGRNKKTCVKKEDRIEANKQKKVEKNSCQKKDEGTKPKQPKLEVPITDDLKSEVRSNSWTREEDKTMLQVLKGEPGLETVIGRIEELLPHRSPTEIKDRFCHVMSLLQQMAVGDVT